MPAVTEYYTEYTLDDKRVRIWSSVEGADMVGPVLKWYNTPTEVKNKISVHLRPDRDEVAKWIEDNLPGVTAVQVNQTYVIPQDFLGKNEPKEVIMGKVIYKEWP